MYYAKAVIDELKSSTQLAVFGAGQVACEVIHCLRAEPYGLSIDYILVSDREGNPDQIMGISVLDLEQAAGMVEKDAVIVIATIEKYLDSICESLKKYGYFHMVPLTFESDRWSLVQGDYYGSLVKSQGKKYRTMEEELGRGYLWESGAEREQGKHGKVGEGDNSVHIYRVRCHVDRALSEDLSRYSWEIPIQAGAALTDQRICDVRDDQGDNISHKNGQYCELTALYWIWKHDSSAYVGLCHYRRHFELDEEMLKRLAYSDIDVVLTIPILNVPSVEEVYRHDHMGRDWDVMMEAVRTLAPDYAETAQELEKGNFYYGYNMVIARKKILDDYCEWLFPILEYCEERCNVREGTYQKRYIGFLAERLMGIYFLRHEDDYKIAHVKKHFVEG